MHGSPRHRFRPLPGSPLLGYAIGQIAADSSQSQRVISRAASVWFCTDRDFERDIHGRASLVYSPFILSRRFTVVAFAHFDKTLEQANPIRPTTICSMVWRKRCLPGQALADSETIIANYLVRLSTDARFSKDLPPPAPG